MSFGAMFAGFVDGVESGYKTGVGVREKRDARRKSDDELVAETNRRMGQDEEEAARAALEGGGPRRPEGFTEGGKVRSLRDEEEEREALLTSAAKGANIAPLKYTLDSGVELRGQGVQVGRYAELGGGASIPVGKGKLSLDAKYGVAPGTKSRPDVGLRASYSRAFAEGGEVPVDQGPEGQSAAQYFAAERDRAIAQGQPTPADPIKGALDWFSNIGKDRAVTDNPQEAKDAAVAAVKEVIPAAGTHLDTTTMVGGISKVVGRQNARPFTFADHLRFLDTYNNVARERNVDPNQMMKFNVQYIDNLRHVAQRTFALGAAAWDSGDTNAVQSFVRQGMGLVPDGLGVRTKFEGDKLHVQQFNEGTGKDVGKPIILDRQGYMRMAGALTGSSLAFGQYLRQTEDERAVALAGAKARAQADARAAAGGGRTGRAPPSEWVDSLKSTDATAFGKELQRLNIGVDRAVADGFFKSLPKNTTPAQAADALAKVKAGTYVPRPDGPSGPGLYVGDELKIRVNPTTVRARPAGTEPSAPAGQPQPNAAPAGRQPPQPTRAPPARPEATAPPPAPAQVISTTPQAPGPLSAQAAPAAPPAQAIPTEQPPAPVRPAPVGRGIRETAEQRRARELEEAARRRSPYRYTPRLED